MKSSEQNQIELGEAAQALIRHEAELTVINIVQEALLKGVETGVIYRLVGNYIRDIFDVQAVTISTFDHKKAEEQFRYIYENQQLISSPPRPIDDLRRKLIRTKELILINEDAEEKFAKITGKPAEPVPGTKFPKSMLFAPLLLGERINGYVSLQNIDREHAFSSHHVDMLKRMANSAAIALESARLFESEKRRADEQKALLDTMTDLSSKLELKNLLDSVVERTVSLLGVTGGELAIYYKDVEELEVVSSHNLGMRSVGTRLALGEGVMGKVAETRESVIIDDYQHWKGRSEKYKEATVSGVMAVPLIVGTQLVGTLVSVHQKADRKFAENDLRLLNMFAPLAATAIENARLFEAERKRADEQQALLDTMTDLSSKLELNQLLDSVVERTFSLLGVTGGELAIYDDDSQELEVVSSQNLGFNSVGTRLKHGEGVMGKVAESREPIIIRDYQHWDGRSEKYQDTTVRGVMAVPLMTGDQLVGTLVSIHLDQDRTFYRDDLRLLNMFAPLAATAIENARLFEAERKRADEQKALLDTMSDLSSKLELRLLLDSVVERASSLLEVTGGELAIYHEERQELEVVSSHNLGMQSVGTCLRLGEGVMGRVAETREPIIIRDYQNWDGRSEKYRQTTVRAVMAVPLMVGSQLVGTLVSIHLDGDRTFGADDLRLLNMFAPLAATAIENARLFDTTNRLLGEAEYRTQELKQTQQQLIMQEKLASLGQLTAGIAHEIKNPLNFVINFSDVTLELVDDIKEELANLSLSDNGQFEMRKADLSELLSDISSNLAKIQNHGTRADRIVKSMLQHSRGGSGELEAIDLNMLVKEYTNLAYHGMRAGTNPINVRIEEILDEGIGQINLVHEDFSRVLLNLTNNAFDAMRDKMTGDGRPATGDKLLNSGEYQPKLVVRTRQSDTDIVVEIEDNGSGIPEEIRENILQPFFTTKKGTEGTGLGLSITHDIIEAHGGSLRFESTDSGTIFTVTLNSIP